MFSVICKGVNPSITTMPLLRTYILEQKYKFLRETDHPLELKSTHSPQNQFTAEKGIHQMMQIWLEILVNKVSKNKLKELKL